MNFVSSIYQRVILICSVICISLMLCGCFPTIFSATGAGAIASAKDRTFGETVDDVTISTKIKKDFAVSGFKDLYTKIDLQVVQGRVLLVGTVSSEENVLKAVEISWAVNGVKEVVNELKVDGESDKFNPAQYAKDSWITSRVKTELFFNRDIKCVNYTVFTHKSVVYLFGIARSEDELQNVAGIASRVAGVEKVVSHVHLREDYTKNSDGKSKSSESQ